VNTQLLVQLTLVASTLLIWGMGWLEQRPITPLDYLLHRVDRQRHRDRLARHLGHSRTIRWRTQALTA